MSKAVDAILTCESVLPEKPDRETVRSFLEEIRYNN